MGKFVLAALLALLIGLMIWLFGVDHGVNPWEYPLEPSPINNGTHWTANEVNPNLR